MKRIRLTLELQNNDGVAGFSRESLSDGERTQKQEIGELFTETLLALENEIVGAYPLTCLAEALVFAGATDADQPGIEPLIEAAQRFLDKEEQRIGQLGAMPQVGQNVEGNAT